MALSQRRTRLLGRLRQRKTRAREESVLVEGVRAATEVLDAGARVRFALASPRLATTPEGEALLARLRGAGVEVEEVSDDELESAADTEHPQGVVLVAAEPSAEAGGLLEGGGSFLVLDAVQDPGNVGTLIRAGAAFGLAGVLALDGTVDAWNPKTVRAAAGTCFRIPVAGVPAGEAVALLEAAGVPLLVADAGGRDVSGYRPGASWALAVGNEGAGCREAVRAAAAATLRIPMTGAVDSLNAGVAGSILMYALHRESHDA